MSSDPVPFTDAELAAAEQVPLTDDILFHAQRTVTQALSEFGHDRMLPVLNGQLALNESERAFLFTFYRLLPAVRTLSELRQGYHFQAISGQTRLIFELCVDIHLLSGNNVPRAVEKFHGFTPAARFSAAYKTVAFYKEHPELEDPGDAEQRRALVNTPGKQVEIETLCHDLWNRREAPSHWSGLRWSEQLAIVDPGIHEWFVRWSGLHAWLIHGGAAGVSGLSEDSIRSIESVCRDMVKALVPEVYRLVAVGMHLHRAVPEFFDELDRIKELVETYAATDARLQKLGHPSKLTRGEARNLS
jgi:hypothetical protein